MQQFFNSHTKKSVSSPSSSSQGTQGCASPTAAAAAAATAAATATAAAPATSPHKRPTTGLFTAKSPSTLRGVLSPASPAWVSHPQGSLRPDVRITWPFIYAIVGLQWILEPALADKDKFAFLFFTLGIDLACTQETSPNVQFGDLLELQVEQIAQLLLQPGACVCVCVCVCARMCGVCVCCCYLAAYDFW